MLDNVRQKVYDTLEAAGIPYQVWEHPAVFTIEEMDALHLPRPEVIAKNLFLRDAKGKKFFLAVLPKDKKADRKALGGRLGVRLSFASEERLEEHLGLTRGSVTPFGVLNDEARAVTVLLDAGLWELPLVGVHPNENTATVVLSPDDLERVVREHGGPVERIEL